MIGGTPEAGGAAPNTTHQTRTRYTETVPCPDRPTLPETDVEQEQQTKRQPPYHVVLLNDDDHTYEYVIEMLKALFGHPVEKGYQLAKTWTRRAGRSSSRPAWNTPN